MARGGWVAAAAEGLDSVAVVMGAVAAAMRMALAVMGVARISYPNEQDIAFARAQGRSPGSDIFIHGGPRPGIDPTDKRDWTAGCISVTDRQIEEIFAMVKNGTPIDIYA